ncbi:hypothetical protein [Enhygromyxa salina]|nr:hypothetical protein [Enhygromyxa salina]
MVDYAPDATIGLPLLGLDRLGLLLDWIAAIISSPEIRRVVIAVSDENEVESAAEVSSADFRHLLITDFEDYAPPNKVYVIGEDRGASLSG